GLFGFKSHADTYIFSGTVALHPTNHMSCPDVLLRLFLDGSTTQHVGGHRESYVAFFHLLLGMIRPDYIARILGNFSYSLFPVTLAPRQELYPYFYRLSNRFYISGTAYSSYSYPHIKLTVRCLVGTTS